MLFLLALRGYFTYCNQVTASDWSSEFQGNVQNLFNLKYAWLPGRKHVKRLMPNQKIKSWKQTKSPKSDSSEHPPEQRGLQQRDNEWVQPTGSSHVRTAERLSIFHSTRVRDGFRAELYAHRGIAIFTLKRNFFVCFLWEIEGWVTSSIG